MTDQFMDDYKRDTLAGLVGRIETLEALLKRNPVIFSTLEN